MQSDCLNYDDVDVMQGAEAPVDSGSTEFHSKMLTTLVTCETIPILLSPQQFPLNNNDCFGAFAHGDVLVCMLQKILSSTPSFVG